MDENEYIDSDIDFYDEMCHECGFCDGLCWECENRTWCWASITNEDYGC